MNVGNRGDTKCCEIMWEIRATRNAMKSHGEIAHTFKECYFHESLVDFREKTGKLHSPPDPTSSAAGPKGAGAGEDLDKIVSQPSLDVHINLSDYWPGLGTLLVDVSPWCLMTNQTDLDLMIVEQNGTSWQLPSKKTFTPPKFEVNYYICWSYYQ